MSTAPLPDQYIAYFDSTFIRALAHPTPSDGNLKYHCNRLIEVFDKHRDEGKLRPVTSEWTIMEAKGVVYGLILEEQGVVPIYRNGRPIKPRNRLPPFQAAMEQASNEVDAAITLIASVSDFPVLVRPDSTKDYWESATRLNVEACIWPNDSIHVATAIQKGCSMFITEDRDLLDKIDWSRGPVIQPLQDELYSALPYRMTFAANAVVQSRSNLSGVAQPNRPPALNALKRLGFK